MTNFFDQFDKPAQGNYFDQFDPTVNPSAQSPANPFQGPLKQAGAGLTEFLASIPGAAPRAYKQIGSIISQGTGLPEPQPIINAPPTPEAQLIAGLPAPQGAVEEATRNLAPFAMSAFQPGHVGENLAGAVGAAGGSYLGSQVAPSVGLTPEQGSLTGAIGGGFAGARTAGNKLNDIRRGNLPSPQEVLNATGDSYDALKKANREIVIPSDSMRFIKNTLLNTLRQEGPPEEGAKVVYSAIKSLDDENGGTVADLINLRQNLHSEFHGGPNANKPAAIYSLDIVDKALGAIAKPGTMAELQRNDANWAGARTAQAVDTKVTQAQTSAEDRNSGLNSGNKIIQSIEAYIKSRTNPVTNHVYMNPADLADLENARKLGVGQKIGRYLENAAGAGGGLGALVAGGVAGLGVNKANEAGYSVTEGKDPLITGVGIPALGLLGRLGFNRSIARAAKNAEASILARTPYVQSVGGIPPQPLLSLPQVTGRSLLFAAPALKNSLFSQDAQ